MEDKTYKKEQLLCGILMAVIGLGITTAAFNSKNLTASLGYSPSAALEQNVRSNMRVLERAKARRGRYPQYYIDGRDYVNEGIDDPYRSAQRPKTPQVKPEQDPPSVRCRKFGFTGPAFKLCIKRLAQFNR